MTFSRDARDGGAVVIPDKVDLREYLWPVESLGDIVASAASAAATALEYHCNRLAEEPTNLSTLFIHYNARRLKGDVQANTGTSIDAAMKAIAAFGACRDASWPFDPKAFAKEPPPQAYAEAKPFAAMHFFNVEDPLEALALKYPVPFMARIPRRCLDEGGRTGVIPPPTTEERDRIATHAGHGMTLVGYDRMAKTFTARNCWGEQWGDKGHCQISFDAMAVYAPRGAGRFLIITKPQAKDEAAPSSSAGVSPMAAAPSSPTRTPPPQVGDLGSTAAKMREEIRSRLQSDLAASTKRIDDLMGRKPAAPEEPRTQASCWMCYSTGSCWWCKGAGCANCSNSGKCPKCRGAGAL